MSTESTNALYEQYKNSNRRILIATITINLIAVVALFSGSLTSLATFLFSGKIFDYYTTYILSLMVFNVWMVIIHFKNRIKQYNTKMIIDIEELGISLSDKIKLPCGEKTVQEVVIDNNIFTTFGDVEDISVGEFIKADLSENATSEKSKEEMQREKTKSVISLDKLDGLKRKMTGERNDMFFGRVFVCLLIMISFAITGLVYGNDRISEHKLVNKYENKYANITQDIEEKERQRAIKDKTIVKLEALKAEYIAQYGTGAFVVTELNNDIENLKK